MDDFMEHRKLPSFKIFIRNWKPAHHIELYPLFLVLKRIFLKSINDLVNELELLSFFELSNYIPTYLLERYQKTFLFEGKAAVHSIKSVNFARRSRLRRYESHARVTRSFQALRNLTTDQNIDTFDEQCKETQLVYISSQRLDEKT